MPALLKGGRKSRARTRTRKTKTKSRRPRRKSSRRKRCVSKRTRKMRGGNGFAFTPGIVRGAGESMLSNPMPFSSYNSCGK